MARDSGGTHTLPAGNPVVDGNTITAAWGNTTLSDLSTEITDSLSRSGKGGMTAALKVANGTVGGPSYTFTNASTWGHWWDNTNTALSVSAAGSLISKWTTAGFFASLIQSLTAVSLRLMGRMANAANAVGVILDTDATYSTSGAKLVSVRNNTTEALAIDKDGAVLGPAAGALLALKGTTANGATAVGVAIDTTNAFSTSGAKIASFRTNAVEKAYIDKDGVVNSTSTAKAHGLITTKTVTNGFNITSVTNAAANEVTVNFTSALASANYAVVIGDCNSTASDRYLLRVKNATVNGFDLDCIRYSDGATVNLQSSSNAIYSLAVFI